MKLLEHKKVQDYVVLVSMIVDTAVIPATSEKEAAELYEMAEMFADKDIAIWAMTTAEFDEMMKQPEGANDGHKSDCALHNEPAYPADPCDCGTSRDPSDGQ